MAIERPILAGNSMGANTILRWAVRHPGDARALIPSGMGVPPDPSAAVPMPAQPLDPETLFLPIGDSLTEGFKKEQPRMYERYLRIRSTATRIEALRHPRKPGEKTLAERQHLGDGVTKISSPMLIVVGSLDRLVPWCEKLHSLVRGSKYRVIEGAPHNVYYEAANEYNAAVDAFLAGVLR
jgi:pimeloyl-ACP methyl ester carboxylesterase